MFDAKYEPLFVEEKLIKEINDFWEYFVLYESQIIDALYHYKKDVMKDFEVRLNKVFFRAKKSLRYQFQKIDGVINFTLFYGHNSYLLTVGSTFLEYKPKKLQNQWKFNVEK